MRKIQKCPSSPISYTTHITVDPSVPPVVHAQRRVTLSLRDDIKDELDDMESRGIITKLKEC